MALALRCVLLAVLVGGWCGPTFAATGAVQIDSAAPAKKPRKPSPPLSSLPAPRASGPLRILLVDDDWSQNNGNPLSKELSDSDVIYRDLVARAVGGEASAWSVEVAPNHEKGPDLERLRGFNVVIWYNGSSYGGSPDHSAVLSFEDEKVVRRYLEETGGSFILISPGYVNAYSYANTWDDAPVAFLTEVAGINGFRGMLKRFAGGTVSADDGTTFEVGPKGPVESMFSALNPDGAAVVFRSALEPGAERNTGSGVAVAVTNPFGGGRFTHVAFSFENIVEADRPRAFNALLAAAGVKATVGSARQPAVAGSGTAKAGSAKTTGISAKPSAPAGSAGAPAVDSQITVPLQDRPTLMAPTVNANATPSATAPTVLGVNQPAQIRDLSGQSIKPPEPGPAPRSLKIVPSSVGVQMVQWAGEPTAKYDVFRQNGSTWQSLATGLANTWSFEDHFFAAAGTVYRVVANYPDNRTGYADATFTNPILPATPTRLSATQTGDGTMKLMFYPDSKPGLEGHRVYASTLSNGGIFVPLTRTTVYNEASLTGLPAGAVMFRVVPQYDGKMAPVEAQLNATVGVWRARYRIILLGFRAVTATKDEDIFGGDGAGDEVYFGAYRALVSRDGQQVQSLGVVRSQVYGDNSRFPTRIRAGSATPTGGIRDGDVVPSDAQLVAKPLLAALPDRLPMLLWDGVLEAGASRLCLGLVGFEWDNTSEVNWNAWRDWWTSAAGAPVVVEKTSRRIGYLETDIPPSVLFGPKDVLVYPTPPAATRPLMLTESFDASYRPRLQHYPQGTVISQEAIEAKLGNRSAVTMGVQMATSLRSTNNGPDLNSEYMVYLQLERMAP